MSAAADRRSSVAHIVFDMEDDVHSLVGWANAIYDLGAGGNEITAAGLFEIGRTMLDRAKSVEADWKLCFELTRHMREGGR